MLCAPIIRNDNSIRFAIRCVITTDNGSKISEFLSFELLHSLMVVAHFPLFLYSFPAFRRNNESNAATFGMCSLAVGTHTMAFFPAVMKVTHTAF